MKLLLVFVSLFLVCQGQYVQIRCNFISDSCFACVYQCNATEFHISNNETQTIVIVGDHLDNRDNSNVRSVRIFNQPLPFVITEFFTTFPNLQILEIRGGLLKIQEGAFNNARDLRILSIFNSPLRLLPANAFDGPQLLRNLRIISCDTETIHQNSFVGRNSLQIIEIINNTNIRSIPERVFSSRNLESITVVGSQIQTLPAKLLERQSSLLSIDFTSNNINAIARSFVDNLPFTKLHQFTFMGNSCGNFEGIRPDVNEIHAALQLCYKNYEQRRNFSLVLQGSLVIRDENENEILNITV